MKDLIYPDICWKPSCAKNVKFKRFFACLADNLFFQKSRVDLILISSEERVSLVYVKTILSSWYSPYWGKAQLSIVGTWTSRCHWAQGNLVWGPLWSEMLLRESMMDGSHKGGFVLGFVWLEDFFGCVCFALPICIIVPPSWLGTHIDGLESECKDYKNGRDTLFILKKTSLVSA